MKMQVGLVLGLLLVGGSPSVRGGTRYVWSGSPRPEAPYGTWETAAQTIQEAVDAAVDGDRVLVTNGLYSTGGRAVTGTMTNRVVIDKAIFVQSVMGPEMTVIAGAPGVGGGNGDGAIRAVYVGINAVLSGFSLTNGHTRATVSTAESSGGGAWCEASGVLRNCVLSGNSAHFRGGGAYRGTHYRCTYSENSANYGGGTASSTNFDCTFTRNSATNGGGAYRAKLMTCVLTSNSVTAAGGGASASRLEQCTIIGNSSSGVGGGTHDTTNYYCTISNNTAIDSGGGTYGGRDYNSVLSGNEAADGGGGALGRLVNCSLTHNRATREGGGAMQSNLADCMLSGNSSGEDGGGAAFGSLYKCVVSSNTAAYNGGGVEACTLTNCIVLGNIASSGGGAFYGYMYNCTVAGNSADTGGGTYSTFLQNSISYYNVALVDPNNYRGESWVTMRFTCTTPLSDFSGGNITNEPAFVDLAAGELRLSYGSPCVDAGTDLSQITTNDLGGGPRPTDGDGDGLAIFDMGAYEFDLRTVVPPEWFLNYGLDPTDPAVVAEDPDGDALTTFQEWIADTNPTNKTSSLRIEVVHLGPPLAVQFASSSNRLYTLMATTNLMQPVWLPVPGQENVPGNGAMASLHDDATAVTSKFYKIGVCVP